ncbi:MAG: hypothetical protein OHK0039_00550 [Bacteroidia bacterium]
MIESIQALRQSGELEEALKLAEQYMEENPGDPAGRLEMAWIHYGFVKQAAKKANLPDFHRHLDVILAQELEGEGILGNSLSWQVHRIAKSCLAQRPVPVQELVALLEKVRRFTFDIEQDIMAYVMMLRLALKVKDRYPGIREFIEWWGLDNLPEAEFEPFDTKQGRRMMSLAERAYITYANQLIFLSETDRELAREKGEIFYPQFEELMHKRPDYRFAPVFRLPMYGVLGRWDEVIATVLGQIKSRPFDVNAWTLLGEALENQDEPEQALICYARAVSIRTKPEMSLRSKEKLGFLLKKLNRLVEAKTEILEVLHMFHRLREEPSENLIKVQEEEWFKKTQARPHNRGLYRQYNMQAENLLYADIPEDAAVITHVDPAKKRAWFRVNEEVTGSVSFGQMGFPVQPGDFIAVRFENEPGPNGQIRTNILTIRPGDEEPAGIIRRFKGVFSLRPGQNFGFVDREIFIPPHLIEQHMLIAGQQLSGMAVREYDQKRDRWSWKAVRLE